MGDNAQIWGETLSALADLVGLVRCANKMNKSVMSLPVRIMPSASTSSRTFSAHALLERMAKGARPRLRGALETLAEMEATAVPWDMASIAHALEITQVLVASMNTTHAQLE